jgi:hypothetical protein
MMRCHRVLSHFHPAQLRSPNRRDGRVFLHSLISKSFEMASSSSASSIVVDILFGVQSSYVLKENQEVKKYEDAKRLGY